MTNFLKIFLKIKIVFLHFLFSNLQDHLFILILRQRYIKKTQELKCISKTTTQPVLWYSWIEVGKLNSERITRSKFLWEKSKTHKGFKRLFEKIQNDRYLPLSPLIIDNRTEPGDTRKIILLRYQSETFQNKRKMKIPRKNPLLSDSTR